MRYPLEVARFRAEIVDLANVGVLGTTERESDDRTKGYHKRRKTGIKSLFSTSNSSAFDKTYMRGTVLMNDAPFVRFCLNVTASFM